MYKGHRVMVIDRVQGLCVCIPEHVTSINNLLGSFMYRGHRVMVLENIFEKNPIG
jgi:hypothetical protein